MSDEVTKAFLYMLWSLGAALAIRQPIDLRTEEGRAAGVQALNGFADLMKLALEEFPLDSPSGVPPWMN